MHTAQLKHIRPLAWPDVFAIWRENEGENSHWREYAYSKGFSSWEEWRLQYVNALRLPEHDDWALYRVPDPLAAVPHWRGGPFNGWIKNFYGERANPAPTFAELAAIAKTQEHGGIQKIFDAFPPQTTVTGLARPEGIVIIEGMHRCCALALAARNGTPIETELTVAIASSEEEALPVVGGYEQK